LLSRFGIELIAEKTESESTVVDLLDYEVKFGQGYLFSQPRPVKADVLQSVVPLDARGRAKTEERPALPEPEPAGKVGPGGTPAAKDTDPRLEALQRPTALAQIARAVAVRAAQ
jgi:cyclic-di-GMP phosphodiesterase TipF (flagellum assembly factor)